MSILTSHELSPSQMLQELHHVLESLGYEVIRVQHPNFIIQEGKSATVKSYKMDIGLEPLKDFLRHEHANIIYLYDVQVQRMAPRDPLDEYKFAVVRCHIVT